MSVRLIPYEPWHILAMFDKQHSQISVDDIQFLAVIYKNRGTAYTVIYGDKIMGCAGIMRLWNNVGEAWTYLSDDLRAMPFALHRIAKRMLQQVIEVSGYHRVQTTVNHDNPVAIRWAKALGMTCEGILKQFGPDKVNYGMYSMVR